jgi:DNA-binding FadR family transcriptional regulator
MAIPDDVDVACEQHHDIFNAMCSQDEEAIRRSVSVHLTLADNAIRSLERAEAARLEPYPAVPSG